jgi:glutamyl-Q tRNA(Asp) synthetase
MPPEYRTRFAPSPTGLLHLGHAFSALTAATRAAAQGGQFLLRIEDIDIARCRAEFEAAIHEDLHWLGLTWPDPVMRQSTRCAAHDKALARLSEMGLTYACTCSRADIRATLSAPQEGAMGVDGPIYPGTCRKKGLPVTYNTAVRLDMAAALDRLSWVPNWCETGQGAGFHRLDAAAMIAGVGDVVLARRDIGTSYHLAVVVDDADQHITEVVRGADLAPATPIHVLLQTLLGLPVPSYHHHRLIRDEAGKRLAKRDDARAIRRYRQDGLSPAQVRALVGF